VARRIFKILHLLGAAGVTGGLLAYMILLATAPTDSMEGYAVVRRGIEVISGKILVPSLVVCLVSGLFAMAVYHPFQNAGWAWVKAGFGLPMFEGTLVTIDSTAQRAASLSAKSVLGEVDPATVADAVAREWNALWIILLLAIGQTVVGVWRPRMWRKKAGRVEPPC
jgi:hypothetical protein